MQRKVGGRGVVEERVQRGDCWVGAEDLEEGFGGGWVVKDCVDSDSEDGCEDERSTENEERAWPVIISPRESSSSRFTYFRRKWGRR